jgi:hypothetical protein
VYRQRRYLDYIGFGDKCNKSPMAICADRVRPTSDSPWVHLRATLPGLPCRACHAVVADARALPQRTPRCAIAWATSTIAICCAQNSGL